MDIIQYLENNEFRLDGTLSRAGPSVEDIALSMRRHLLRDGQNEASATGVRVSNSTQPKDNPHQPHLSVGLRECLGEPTDQNQSAGSSYSSELQGPGQQRKENSFRSQCKSQFYEELRKKYPQAFKKRPVDTTSANATHSRPSTPATLIASSISDISGRSSRPSTPVKSMGDSAGLARAASLLLARNRLNSSYSSDGESGQRNEDTPALDSRKKQSLSERLKQNSMKMNSLLRHPSFTRFRSEPQSESIANESTPASSKPNGVQDKLSSSPDSPHDSAIEAGDNVSGSIDGMYINAVRPGLITPVAYCENDCEKKGYHTCESDDCDSGIGRYEGKENRLIIQESRIANEPSMPLQSNAREVLKMLQKKKEQTSSTSMLQQKSNRPVKADHNITPVKHYGVSEAVQQKKPTTNGYIEDVGHRVEILPDTPIRNENSETSQCLQDQTAAYRGPEPPLHTLSPLSQSLMSRSPSRTSMKSNCSVISRKSTQSNTSNRSVRFEEPITDKPRAKPRPASAMARTELHPSLNGNSSKKSRSTTAVQVNASDLQAQMKPDRRSQTPDPSPTQYPSNGLDTYGIHRQQQSFKESHPLKKVSNPIPARPKSAVERSRKKNFAPIPPPPEWMSQSSRLQRPQSAGPSFSFQQGQTQSKFPSKNPCVVRGNIDDEITELDVQFYQQRSFASDVDHYSELSDSRTSLSSRSSISDKFQNLGKATKQKFSKMRRALSLERLDSNMERRESRNSTKRELKKSPSLRSLTNLFGGKGREKKLDYDKSFSNLNGKGSRPSSAMSDIIPSSRRSRYSSPSPRYSSASDIELPSHLRKVGRLLKMNSDRTQVIELVRPPSGPFGFYIAKGKDALRKSIFVSRLSDGYADKIFTGLLAVGDEILEINYQHVQGLALDDVYELMADQPILVLKVLPFSARKEWESHHHQ